MSISLIIGLRSNPLPARRQQGRTETLVFEEWARSVRAWLALAVSTLCTVVTASARGEEPVRQTEEIVVEDQRLRPAEVFEDTAIEKEVIEEQKIEALPARDVSDIVRNLPGIRTQQRVQGEDAIVSIEGMPPEYTKILVNGARYVGAIDGVTDLADIPAFNLQRIEVLRGNQGVRYGTDAAGGVINIVTKPAPDEGIDFLFDGGGGQDGQASAFGATGFRLGNLGVTTSFGQYEIDGFDPPDDIDFTQTLAGNADSHRLERNFYSTLDYDLTENVDLYGRVGWRREDWDYVNEIPSDEVEATKAAAEEAGVPFDRRSVESREYETWTSTAGFSWSPGDATTIHGDVNYFSGTTDSEVGREFFQVEDQYQVNLVGEHFVELGPTTSALLAALDWRRSSLVLENGPPPPDIDPSDIRGGDVDKWFYQTSLYFESDTALYEWMSLILGLRLQQHSQFSEALLPQVALLFRPHETVRLRFSWGLNQRTPSLRDLYQPESPQLGGSYFLAGNPDLTEESSESWRAGIDWSPHRVVSFSVVGFWNTFDDSIRSVLDRDIRIGTVTATGTGDLSPEIEADFLELCSDPLIDFRLIGCDRFVNGGTPGAGVVTEVFAPVYKKVNLDSVRTRGAEVRMNLRPYDPWQLEIEVGYTYLDTDVNDRERPNLKQLPNEPNNVVDARIFFVVPRWLTSVAFSAQWRDRAIVEKSGTGLLGFADDTTDSDPAFLLDARIAQPLPWWRNVEVYLDARNLTNTRVVDSYAVRGRTFFLGVRANWNPKGPPAWFSKVGLGGGPT
jgi:outer membrane receptor for ferrienterochelin and colicin